MLDGAVAHDDRPRRHVAQALVTLRQQHQQDAGDERREGEKEVDEPQQVAHYGRAHRHRSPGVHDDADPERPLADGAPAPEGLQQHVIKD